MSDDFQYFENADLAGSLVLAHPHLRDPNFVRTVVLMTAHEKEGSLGVVVNRPSGKRLKDVSEEFEIYGLGEVPLFEGGPVASDQIILAAWNLSHEAGSFKLYFGLEPSAAREKLEEEPELQVRAFRGYAGWGEGQLENELKERAWVVARMDGEAFASLEGEELWRRVLSNLDPKLGLLALAPDRPEDN